MFWNQDGGTDAHRQYQEDKDERADSPNLHILMDEHLGPDEDEQHADAHLQIAELVCHGSQ